LLRKARKIEQIVLIYVDRFYHALCEAKSICQHIAIKFRMTF
jgi:hypothetical protein